MLVLVSHLVDLRLYDVTDRTLGPSEVSVLVLYAHTDSLRTKELAN